MKLKSLSKITKQTKKILQVQFEYSGVTRKKI